MPLGEGFGGATYFMLEIHYDNPAYHKDLVDTSGKVSTFIKVFIRNLDLHMSLPQALL